MRVSLQMNTNSCIDNMRRTSARVYQLQNQLASGVRVNKPSDDPSAASVSLRYGLLIDMCQTYRSNIATADFFLGMSDSALSSIGTKLNEALSLVIGAANGTNTQSMLDGYAVEMRTHLQALVALANSTAGGQFLFGGTSTREASFEVINDKYVLFTGNSQYIKTGSSAGISTAMNVIATESFGNMATTINSEPLLRLLNMSQANPTRLQDLNGGAGVRGDSLTLKWTAAPEGLSIDLSAADDLYDVATIIEQASIARADSYDPTDPEYNYILKVGLNADRTGLELIQYDRSVDPPVAVDLSTDPNAIGIFCGNSLLAVDLGIAGGGSTSGISVLSGGALKPSITANTLLSDLRNWSDNDYVVYNGDDPLGVTFSDSQGTDSYFSNWQLTGLSEGQNISGDGDLYYKLTELGGGEWQLDIYNHLEMKEQNRIATGQTADSVFVLEPVNDSGVSGTVLVAPPASLAQPHTGGLRVVFDTPFTAVVSVSAFSASGGTSTGVSGISSEQLAANWKIHGLETVTNAGEPGVFQTEVIKHADDFYTVNLWSTDTEGTARLVATGDLINAAQGTVVLKGTADFSQIEGQVDLSCPLALSAGTYDFTLRATEDTVGDFLSSINGSETYLNAQISASGDNIEISSRLSGAYLRVTQNYSGAVVSGQGAEQLCTLNLQGVAANFNSDAAGNLYSSVTLNPDTMLYTVNVYSDRECTNLVALGSTTVNDSVLVLQEQNNSGITGSVYLQYSGDAQGLQISATGLTALNDGFSQISTASISGLVPGVTADYYGCTYLSIEEDTANLGTYNILLYSDSARKNLVASGNATSAASTVTLSEVNGSGVGGSLYLNYSADDADIILRPGAAVLSGRAREENTFSLFTDAIDAMTKGDIEALAQLLADFTSATDRILNARATIGSTQNLLTLFDNRHETSILFYTEVRSTAVDLDLTKATTEYAAAYATYQAALQTSSKAMSLSLFSFL